MTDFDLVIRNGTIATAADVFAAEIGIHDERIAALGTGLGAGREEIDATGLLVLPGGVDAHCHLDQPTTDGRSARTFPQRHGFGGLRRDHHGHSFRRADEGVPCALRSRIIIAVLTARR